MLTPLRVALIVLVVAVVSFAAGVFYEARDTRSELIAAADTARKEAAAEVKKQYDNQLKLANDATKKAERERDEAKRNVKVEKVVDTIIKRVRVPGVCEFTPEDIRDINSAGH